jgi:hypothetical protein
MPQYSAGTIYLESGNSYANYQPMEGVTSLSVNYSIPRANVNVLNRGKPLAKRPVINYTPVDVSIDYYKMNSMVEASLGLINPISVTTNLVETKSGPNYAVKGLRIYYAPTSSTIYNGFLDIKSGVMTSYSVQGSVGEPVRGNITMQCLDMSGNYNGETRDNTDNVASLVKPENISLTGIHFTGVGITGATIQSFSFSLGVGRTQVQQLGLKYPIERPLTDVSASIQVQGFYEGINNSFSSLESHSCGDPMPGEVKLTMTQSCLSSSPSTVINVVRPYFDSFSSESQAGGFTTFSLSLSAPIGPNPNEISDGSVVKIT